MPGPNHRDAVDDRRRQPGRGAPGLLQASWATLIAVAIAL
jgi:hypothetical protein